MKHHEQELFKGPALICPKPANPHSLGSTTTLSQADTRLYS